MRRKTIEVIYHDYPIEGKNLTLKKLIDNDDYDKLKKILKYVDEDDYK